jgi:hypothetical protein
VVFLPIECGLQQEQYAPPFIAPAEYNRR